MNKRDAKLRLKLIKQQLTIFTLYEEEFKQKLGTQGVEDFVNSRLDEIRKLLKILKDE
ncbi:MAG: hypothetical protein AB8G11_00470 [Saprospiraceae bacterium]